MSLRKTATAEADGSADYDSQSGDGYLYSAPLTGRPIVIDTDLLFGVCAAAGARRGTDWECCSFSCVNGACAAPFTVSSAAVADRAMVAGTPARPIRP